MIRKLLAGVAIAAALIASPAFAQSIPAPRSSAGAGQFGVSINAATTLTVPAYSTMVKICVEAQAARWRDDGTAPTATVGIPVTAGTCFEYGGPLSAFQIIGAAAGGTLDALYYR